MAEAVVKGAECRFVAVNYELCPNVSMTEIVNQVEAAVRHVHDLALQQHSRGIYLVGHSAGAHLAAMALDRIQIDNNSSSTDELTDLIKGVILVSGIFDLRPLLETSENFALKMTEQEAWSLSPINQDVVRRRLGHRHDRIKVIVAVAEDDSPAFIQQSTSYSKILNTVGVSVTFVQIAETDHFDVIERMQNVEYQLTQMLIEMVNKDR
jgi:arylformamidase